MAKKTFAQGALILTAAGICGKILSAGYRVPFNRMVGSEGAGLYSMSYSIYSIIFALSTAGIPLAVSKMIAVSEERKSHGESLAIVRVAALLLTLIGLFCAVAFYLAAPWIAEHYFEEPRVMLSLRALAPAMLFSCLMAVFRGFFQGRQNMVPTAISQILEQFFRVGTILIVIVLFIGWPLPIVVAGASLGSMIGGLMGFLFLGLLFIKWLSKHPEVLAAHQMVTTTDQEIVKKLLYYAIPISIGALMLPIMQFIDSSLVARRLESAGLIHEMAISQLGYISNYAMPIINLPFIVTTAISASLVPAVADAFEINDRAFLDQNVRSALTATMILTLPASCGLLTLGTPISVLLYNDAQAGPVLSYLAFTVMVVGIYQASAGALQGMGYVLIPMVSLLIGALGKVMLTWWLPTLPSLHVKGAALATVLSFSVAALHNVFHLSRKIGWQWFSLKQTLLKPVAASLVMSLFVVFLNGFLVQRLTHPSLSLALSILLGGMLYFVVLFLMGGIEGDVLNKIPKIGPKLAKKWNGRI